VKDIKIVDGDIVFEKGDIAIVEGADELRQTVYIGMQTNQGEWFLNPEIGIRHAAFVGKKPNDEEMRAEIIRGAMQDERIQSVEDIRIERDMKNRKLIASFRAVAASGESIEGQVTIGA
jgi:Fe-S cluster assembly ATPase SufC